VDFTYPRNIPFKCLKCSLCCGDTKTRVRHILLLEKEANKISEKTSKPIKEFANRIEGRESYVYEMHKNAETSKCIFLEHNRCTVYALRPTICRFYPFELKVTRDEEHEFDFTVECPGIGKGKALRKDYFDGLFLHLCQSVE